jgi:hypothetical protein
VEANSTGGQGSRRAVAPGGDDDDGYIWTWFYKKMGKFVKHVRISDLSVTSSFLIILMPERKILNDIKTRLTFVP